MGRGPLLKGPLNIWEMHIFDPCLYSYNTYSEQSGNTYMFNTYIGVSSAGIPPKDRWGIIPWPGHVRVIIIEFASLSANSLYIHTVHIHPSYDKDLRQDINT
jgi:hypothetical protein